MAAALVVGDKFRSRVRQLLEKTDSALPPRLRDELRETLEKAEPATLSFSAARALQQHLQGEGKALTAPGPHTSPRSNPAFWLIPGHPFYLHELLEDSSLHLPRFVKPPRVSEHFETPTLLFRHVCQARVLVSDTDDVDTVWMSKAQ